MDEKDIDQAKTESFILIKFEEYGSGVPQIYFNQVNAFQILGASEALKIYGQNMFMRELQEAAQQQEKIAVAKPEILRPWGSYDTLLSIC